jgi:hypothetical protein
MGIASVRYCLLVITGAIHPSLATWLLFDIAVFISFFTYRSTKNRNLIDNIGNTTDIIATSLIFASVIYSHGGNSLKFNNFDLWCLGGAAIIFLFWVVKKNHVAANLATQVLLSIGYFPTLRKLWVTNANPESPEIWAMFLISSIISLYPAVRAKNRLATVYAARSIIFILAVIVLMVRLELRN